jgi:hypothetical protein
MSKLPKEAMQVGTGERFLVAWEIERTLRQKYMVAFMVSALVNVVLFWMVTA